MKPKSRALEQDDLLPPRLTDIIDMRHELVKLAALIDWDFFEPEWVGFFPSHTGRVMRDIQRQLGRVTDDSLRQRVAAEIVLVDRLLRQKPKDKGKLYALHEPEVDCISKGKARVRYEFGTKVSVATTHKEGFVVGMRSMPGNPYDGHTLREALEQVEILTDTRPKRAFVDRGYRGHGVQTTAVYIAGQKRGMTPALRRDLRRRSAIEPMIGHMKTDGRLARCALKGTLGDALHAVLCGCGHNIRMILAHLRALWAEILGAFYAMFGTKGDQIAAQTGLRPLAA